MKREYRFILTFILAFIGGWQIAEFLAGNGWWHLPLGAGLVIAGFAVTWVPALRSRTNK